MLTVDLASRRIWSSGTADDSPASNESMFGVKAGTGFSFDG